jgi:hypothetical protein
MTDPVDDEHVNNINGLVDEVAKLSEDKQEWLNESIRPVKLALVKVIFNSTYRLCTSKYSATDL